MRYGLDSSTIYDLEALSFCSIISHFRPDIVSTFYNYILLW